MACDIGLTTSATHPASRDWTPEEDGVLLELYGVLRPRDLSEELGRAIHAVHHRADRLGLFSIQGSAVYLQRQSLPRTGTRFTGLEDPVDRGYVAGIVDGEGSILGPPRITVSVTTTTKSLATRLQTLAGGTVAGPYLYARRKRFGDQFCNLKPQYHWNFDSQYDVYLLLKRLRPFLVVKAKEADRGIRYLERAMGWTIE